MAVSEASIFYLMKKIVEKSVKKLPAPGCRGIAIPREK